MNWKVPAVGLATLSGQIAVFWALAGCPARAGVGGFAFFVTAVGYVWLALQDGRSS